MRRVGRIAQHIEKYKHSIKNSCAVHKVQLFIGNKYNIVASDRKIVRRGMLRCRMANRIGPENQFIFFLFNDVLIWTSEDGKLQNQVELRYCELFPPNEGAIQGNRILLKFGEKAEETIMLKCISQQETEEWRYALESEINAMRSVWPSSGLTASNKGRKPFLPLPDIQVSDSTESKAIMLSDYNTATAEVFTNEIGGLRSKEPE